MRTREQKRVEVERLRDRITRAHSVLVADYRGLTVAEANELRAKLRRAGDGGIEYRVAKNTLIRLAVRGTPSEALERWLRGPTALAIGFGEPAVLVKALVDFAKKNEKFEIKGGIVEGELADSGTIQRLAALPSRDELRAKLAVALGSPLRNLASTLGSLLGGLRNALEQRQRQLEAGTSA